MYVHTYVHMYIHNYTHMCEFLWTSEYQFRFKKGHSTDLCIYLLKEYIQFYKQHYTRVFVTFLDASKAFDRVNHLILFNKLSAKGMPIYLIRIIDFWYEHQNMSVKWGNETSTTFTVTNGVKQGGIL